jgi:hypothetical protein
MCCGAEEAAPSYSAAGVPDPQGQPADDQRYLIQYLNGTSEEVVGLDLVRRKAFNPDIRAEGTDPVNQGCAAYARI